MAHKIKSTDLQKGAPHECPKRVRTTERVIKDSTMFSDFGWLAGCTHGFPWLLFWHLFPFLFFSGGRPVGSAGFRQASGRQASRSPTCGRRPPPACRGTPFCVPLVTGDGRNFASCMTCGVMTASFPGDPRAPNFNVEAPPHRVHRGRLNDKKFRKLESRFPICQH